MTERNTDHATPVQPGDRFPRKSRLGEVAHETQPQPTGSAAKNDAIAAQASRQGNPTRNMQFDTVGPDGRSHTIKGLEFVGKDNSRMVYADGLYYKAEVNPADHTTTQLIPSNSEGVPIDAAQKLEVRREVAGAEQLQRQSVDSSKPADVFKQSQQPELAKTPETLKDQARPPIPFEQQKDPLESSNAAAPARMIENQQAIPLEVQKIQPLKGNIQEFQMRDQVTTAPPSVKGDHATASASNAQSVERAKLIPLDTASLPEKMPPPSHVLPRETSGHFEMESRGITNKIPERSVLSDQMKEKSTVSSFVKEDFKPTKPITRSDISDKLADGPKGIRIPRIEDILPMETAVEAARAEESRVCDTVFLKNARHEAGKMNPSVELSEAANIFYLCDDDHKKDIYRMEVERNHFVSRFWEPRPTILDHEEARAFAIRRALA